MKNRLLMIDSEAFDRDIMSKVFSGQYDVGFATHPNECEKVCLEFLPDLVLYEIRSPEIELVKTACEALTRYDPGVPLVVIVSHNTLELERYARMNRVFYYLIRPFNFKELWDVVEAGMHATKTEPETIGQS